MRNKILSFFFIAFALFAWAMPVRADVDWSSKAVPAPTEAGFYYIYNSKNSNFLIRSSSTIYGTQVAFNDAASMLYVKKTGDDTYSFAYSIDGTIKYAKIPTSYTSYGWNATSWDISIESTGNENEYYFLKGSYFLNIASYNTNYPATSAENASTCCFIPYSDFQEGIGDRVSNEWTARAATISNEGEKGLYYIYHPKSGAFLTYDKKLKASTADASLFQVIEQDGTYRIMTANTSGNGVIYVNTTNNTWNATAVDFVISQKGSTKRYVIYTAGDTKKYIVASQTNSTTRSLNTIIVDNANYPYSDAVVTDDQWNEWVFIPANSLESEAAEGDGKTGVTPAIVGQYFLWNADAKKFIGKNALVSDAQQAMLCTIGGTEEAKTISYKDQGMDQYIACNAMGVQMGMEYTFNWEEASSGAKEYYLYHTTSAANIYLSSDNAYAAFRGVAIKNDKCPTDLNGKYRWVFVAPDKVAYYTALASSDAGGEVSVSANGSSSEYGATTSLTGRQNTISDATDVQVTYTAKSAVVTTETGYELEGSFLGWYQGEALKSTNKSYTTTIAVANGTIEEPTEMPELHAKFKLVSAYDAILVDSKGEAVKIGGKEGGSLADVISTAYTKSNSTVVLVRDVNLTAAQTITNDLSLDLNNYTISGDIVGASTGLLVINAGAGKTVKITDNSENHGGAVKMVAKTTTSNSEHYAVLVQSGTLNLMGGSILAENTVSTSIYVAAIKAIGGKLLMTGGKVESVCQKSTGTKKNCGIRVAGETEVEIEDGMVSATAAPTSGTTRYNYAYGMFIEGTDGTHRANVHITWNANIKAEASGNYAYGVYVDRYADVVADGGEIKAYRNLNSSNTNNYIVGFYFNTWSMTCTATISGSAKITAENVWGTTYYGTQGTYALYLNNSGCEIKGGYFKTIAKAATLYDAYGTASFFNLKAGYFAHNAVCTGTTASANATLDAIKASGSQYTNDVPASISAEGYNYQVFIPDVITDAVATANNKGFASLEDAIAYANNNADITMTIRLQKPTCTLSAGTYTIPEKATLLIPYSTKHLDSKRNNCPKVTDNSLPQGAFCKLTLAPNTHINVYGAIELGGQQNNYGTGATGTGRPNSNYGQIDMGSGSDIIFNNGANFYAWGFVTGEGTIDVRRGATVYEMFQVYDFKGGNGTVNMCHEAVIIGRPGSTHSVFPVTQYFIQNIEVPTKYRPGAALYGAMAAVNQGMNVKVIGVNTDAAAIFYMNNDDDSEDTWVRKSYDAAHDRQVYEINNSAAINNLELNLGYFTFNSKNYTLPITNNFKIHLLSGEMHITQNTVFLPGVDLEINKLSTVTVNEGMTLYLYDKDQWGTYVYNSPNNAYASRIKYRPVKTPTNSERDISEDGVEDAQINIHGTIAIEGALRTTDGGAYIFSTNEDAGTVSFGTNSNATDLETDTLDTWVRQHYAAENTTHDYINYHAASAQLQNASGHTSTVGAEAGTSYCYINGKWLNLTDADDVCMVYDQYGVYYIKPQAYVPISQGLPSAEADHTYRDHYAGTNKIYINTPDCQWWEVVPVEGHPDLFECQHPKNHTYYYYTGDHWAEKKFKVSWVNWDGSPVNYESVDAEATINYYYVTYGTVPQWFGENPSRSEDDYYTYDFTGWYPTPAAVAEDVVYTAQYNKTDRKYIITFKEGETVLETQYLRMGQVPVCGTTGKPGAGNSWTPAISAVTGDATYTLAAIPSGPFEIKFVNWDGTVLKKENGTDDAIYSVASGATPVYDGAPPTKPALADETYAFSGWTPETVAAADNAVYMATFTPSKPTFTIRFFDDQAQQIGEAQTVEYGAMPTLPDPLPTKTSPAAHKNYTLVWSPLVKAATANQDYSATFIATDHLYTITWKDGNGNTLNVSHEIHGSTPVYSGTTPTKATEGETAYVFNNTWSPGISTVNGNQVYVAQFDPMLTTIVVNDGENEEISSSVTVQEIIIHKGGKVTATSGATITTDNLIIETDGNESGQLIASLANATNAFFDWTPNGETGTASRTWYAIAVPWEVDAENGIFLKETGRHLVIGQDFDLIYYDGETRASQGNKPSCWKYVQNQSDKIMHPGQLYMMYFDPGFVTIRFAKKSGSAVIYNSPVNVSTYSASDDKDANWNGIANPRTYYASLSAGSATYAQVLNNGNLDDYFADPGVVYQTINLASSKFTVGKPLFVQATQATSVVVTKQTTAGIVKVNAAPRRRAAAAAAELPKGIDAVYRLAIAGEDQPEADNLFVQVAENEKVDRYTIGQDLVKGGVASGRAQVWVNRYDAKLSVNTQALSEDEATYPLTIQVPANGDYVLSVGANENEDYALYLTRDGEAIWNLSDGAYTGAFEKGTTSEYGLRVSARAPQIATGIDEAVVDAKGETRKVLINNTVYIIRGENVYSVDGQLVK